METTPKNDTMLTDAEIRKELLGATEIPAPIMNQVYQKRWLQIWVPKVYGGLGYRLAEGLSALHDWAKIDGSLGWMLTLCAGANYFSRNLEPAVAARLFSNPETCFGGSGMIGGTAERLNNGDFHVSGQWRFATGAPHLSHFTLNARIVEPANDTQESTVPEEIRSFVVPKEQAEIIVDWKSMGMKASGTYSFKIQSAQVKPEYSFVYNRFYTNDPMDRVPFRIFADLTLLVNYLGMAAHFAEEAREIRPLLELDAFSAALDKHLGNILFRAAEIESTLAAGNEILQETQSELHSYSTQLVENLAEKFLGIYTQLGVRATQTDSPAYQVFSDFFTATQHSNFRPVPGKNDFSF